MRGRFVKRTVGGIAQVYSLRKAVRYFCKGWLFVCECFEEVFFGLDCGSMRDIRQYHYRYHRHRHATI